MEINISALRGTDLWPCYGSQATHGQNAAQDTFKAAKEVSLNLLDTAETVEKFRDHLKGMGMDETESMDKITLEGVLVQCVAAELRENGFVLLEDMYDTRGVEEYDEMRIFFGTDGEYYYQLV
jgi:hypothetical protein